MTDLYNDLISVLHRELTADGLPNDLAAQASVRVVATVCEAYGGQAVYLPRRVPWSSRTERDRAIRREFNGRNLREVCRQFNVSKRTVYRACKK